MDQGTAIKRTYRQWKLVEQGVAKNVAYMQTGGEVENEYNCHFCDAALRDRGEGLPKVDCGLCLAKGLWHGDASRGMECTHTDSPFMAFQADGDADPMLELIRYIAEFHGVDLSGELG